MSTLVVVAALTIAAGVVAREIYRQPQLQSTPTTTASVGDSTPAPSSRQPGSPRVRLTAGALEHSRHEAVRTVLQTFFDAINNRDYDLWRKAVTRARVAQTTELRWRRDYRSTTDGNILVYRIDRARTGGLRVLVGFTSVQDVADAPPPFPYRCIRWRLILPMIVEDGRLKIAQVPPGTTVEHDRCES